MTLFAGDSTIPNLAYPRALRHFTWFDRPEILVTWYRANQVRGLIGQVGGHRFTWFDRPAIDIIKREWCNVI